MSSDRFTTRDTRRDQFWAENIKILFQKDRFNEFFPTIEMSTYEKLNAVSRLSIYAGILLYFYNGDYLMFYIPIIILLLTFIIYKLDIYKENQVLNVNDVIDRRKQHALEALKVKAKRKYLPPKKDNGEVPIHSYGLEDCVKPSIHNPFMNIDLIGGERDRKPGCLSYNNPKLKKDMENKFGYNLYRDVSDLWGKSNSERQFYTMPATTIPNQQTTFAKWLYRTDETCKENTIKCGTTYMDKQIIDTMNPYDRGAGIVNLQGIG